MSSYKTMKTLFFTLTAVIALTLCNIGTANAQYHIVGGGAPAIETEPSGILGMNCSANPIAGTIISITYTGCTVTIVLDLFASYVLPGGMTIFQTNTYFGTKTITFNCCNFYPNLTVGTTYASCT